MQYHDILLYCIFLLKNVPQAEDLIKKRDQISRDTLPSIYSYYLKDGRWWLFCVPYNTVFTGYHVHNFATWYLQIDDLRVDWWIVDLLEEAFTAITSGFTYIEELCFYLLHQY
jgi:hypothetical protein